MRHRLRCTAAFALMMLAGARHARAQSLPDKLPVDWNDEGLVVGQIVGGWAIGLSTAGDYTKPKVGRKEPDGGIYRGLILFKRGEGEHELKDLHNLGFTFPIGRKFAVKKGEITMLGMMTVLPDRQDPTRKKYSLAVVDNTEEIMDFLRRTYPAVLAGHENAKVVLAPANWVPSTRVAAIRNRIAVNEARRTKRQGQFWVAGIAGTIAEVSVTGDSVRVLRFLPPVTYEEPITYSYDEKGVLTFAALGSKWRVVNNVVEPLTDGYPPASGRQR